MERLYCLSTRAVNIVLVTALPSATSSLSMADRVIGIFVIYQLYRIALRPT